MGEDGPGRSVCADQEDVISMKKFISIIAACVGTLLLTAGIAIPRASAGPTTAPGTRPTVVANHPPAPNAMDDDDDGIIDNPGWLADDDD